jgi:hypothetical protein
MKSGTYELDDILLTINLKRDSLSPELAAAITFDLQNTFCNIYNNLIREHNKLPLQVMNIEGLKPVNELMINSIESVFDEEVK